MNSVLLLVCLALSILAVGQSRSSLDAERRTAVDGTDLADCLECKTWLTVYSQAADIKFWKAADIDELIETICSSAGQHTSECCMNKAEFYKVSSDQVFDPSAVCDAVLGCPSGGFDVEDALCNLEPPTVCRICRSILAVAFMRFRAQKRFEDVFSEAQEALCRLSPGPEICEDLARIIGRLASPTPRRVCRIAGLCKREDKMPT